MTVTCTLKGFTKLGESGKPIERRFCPECGASILDECEVMPGFGMIAAGTLDDRIRPEICVYRQ